jgi:shikimate kinase
MNVVLVGLRGSGKSTVGRCLAKELDREFVDCDELIEQRTLLPIAEIFQICGESYFRLLESEVIEELSRTNGKVIATGGGAILRRRNILALKRNGLVFFLDVDPEIAFDRLTFDPSTASRRPALTVHAPLDELREQARQRRAYYLKAADRVVPVDNRGPDEIAREILEHVRSRPEFPG